MRKNIPMHLSYTFRILYDFETLGSLEKKVYAAAFKK